ncbi:MAG: hypothetical protein DU429_05290 [Candidatus Tokpelaia sp.]|nr:MAG: hypothetical protein DU430_07760 [Candidatus Tokpelaia sp.]KAA6206873.1 MAG: hypothetical protein DU429_05290 [Candidatus Tokpelaia sp.]
MTALPILAGPVSAFVVWGWSAGFPFRPLFCWQVCLNIGENSDKIASLVKFCRGGLLGKFAKRAAKGKDSKGRKFFACAL